MPEFYRHKGVKGYIRGRERNHKVLHAHFIYAEHEISASLTEAGIKDVEGFMPRAQMKQIRRDMANIETRQLALELWAQWHGKDYRTGEDSW